MAITKDKWIELHKRMQKIELREENLIEKFIMGSGPGGQKINKTASCVYLKHIPTGIEVKCQRDRSREVNRYLARKDLCEKIEGQIFHIESQKQKDMEKIRRQKRRKSRKQKAKMIEEKRHRGEIKSSRKSPHD